MQVTGRRMEGTTLARSNLLAKFVAFALISGNFSPVVLPIRITQDYLGERLSRFLKMDRGMGGGILAHSVIKIKYA